MLISGFWATGLKFPTKCLNYLPDHPQNYETERRAAGRQLSAFPPLGSSVSILLHLLGLFVLGKEQGVSAIHLARYSDQDLPPLCLITFSLLHIAERDLAKEKGFSRWSAASCRQCSMLHVSINIRRLLLPWRAQKTGEMIVSQEGGPPAAVMFIYTVEFGFFLEPKTASPPPLHIVHSPPVWSSAGMWLIAGYFPPLC